LTHLLQCSNVPDAVKLSFGKGAKRRAHRSASENLTKALPLTTTTPGGPMDAFCVAEPMAPDKYRELGHELLRVILYCNISFNCMQSPPLVAFFLKWIPGLQRVPSPRDLSGNILEEVYGSVRDAAAKVYQKGVHVVLTIDGWKSRSGTKLLGVLLHNTRLSDGMVTTDLHSTVDITGLAETGHLVQDVLQKVLDDGQAHASFSVAGVTGVDQVHTSTAIGVVSDSASPNVAAKKALVTKYPALIASLCYAHQINLMMGNILTHPMMRAVAAQCCILMAFFTRSTKYMGRLQLLMEKIMCRRLGFIKKGETRWYSHHGMVRRILQLMPALVEFSNTFVMDEELRQADKGARVVALLHNSRFWERASIMRTLLRPLVVELGVIERRASNFADVASSFGRLFAFFSSMKNTTSSLMPDGAVAVAPLFSVPSDPTPRALTHLLAGTILKHVQWRFTFYYEAELLVLAHALDPSRHLQGLRHLSGDYSSKEALITKFMALCLRLGLPTEGNINQNPNALAETIQTAMDYFDGGPRPLLDLKLGTVPGPHVVEAVAR